MEKEREIRHREREIQRDRKKEILERVIGQRRRVGGKEKEREEVGMGR